MKFKTSPTFKSFVEKTDYYPPIFFESGNGKIIIDNGVILGSFNNFDESGNPICRKNKIVKKII
jgi:hypothetical protein